MNAGAIMTMGAQSDGIDAETTSTTGVSGAITIMNDSAIMTVGDQSAGIRVMSTPSEGATGVIDITNAGAITTAGEGSPGITVVRNTPIGATGMITITNSNTIATAGSQSAGILALPTTTGIGVFGVTDIRNSGTITTIGDQSAGVLIEANRLDGSSGAISILNDVGGDVMTSGASSDGLRAIANAGAATVTSNANVTAIGNFSAGISAFGDTTNITVGAGATIMGGWQADLTSVGADDHPSAGVVMGSQGGVATLTNNGTIGALSDRAIFGDADIVNNGTINGFVQLTGVNDLTNNGTFNLRHFADTNGDLVRDTLRVAVSNLGSGPSVFANNGLLALPGSPSATTLDSTGQYLPLGLTFNSMALSGPVQGQILGATQFINSGTIDLTANPVPGDVLVISGGQTAGQNGGGVFLTNGGRLLVNTVLNEGGANSRSDVLVVDSTRLGSAPTAITVDNAGGTGARTVGDGIALVEVLDKSPGASDPGVFTLANGELRGGAFDYRLFHNGLGADAADGNWYLRNTFIEGPLQLPILGPELATDGVVQPIARQMGLAMLGTLHERIGDTLTVENSDPFAEGWGRSGWARFFGQQIDNRYQSYVAPSASGQMFGVQAGFDIWRGSFVPGHRDAAGLYFAYSNSSMDVDGLVTNPAATAYVRTRTGSLSLLGYAGGAYWTHYGPGGWYLDAVLQGTVYNGTATTGFASLPTNGSGILTSLEVGYPIRRLPLGPQFILEPQGQVIWQHTSFQPADDGLGRVALGSTSGVTGRLGVRGQWTIDASGGEVWQPYARANLWQNWGGKATTTFGGVDAVPLLEQSTQLEFAAGVTAKLNPMLSVYAQAGYTFAISGLTDGGLRQGVKGDIGLRLTFGQPTELAPAPAPAVVPAPAAARSYLVFFDWDRATLTDRARQIIREAANSATRVQYTRIVVNGHTDISGTPRYNMGLSLRRAQAVAGELVRDGVPASAIAIRGFGQTRPLVATGPGVREPQNRRVEIVID